jgi:hypothetical protein
MFGNAGFVLSVTDGQRIELFSDMRDVQVAANIPEPMTWTMMLAGFGLMGVALRRRLVDGDYATTV